MAEEHGARTIKGWMEDLVKLARSDVDFDVSAGAEPNRTYAYLEFHVDGEHSLLLFRVEEGDEGPVMHAHHVHGSPESVRERVAELTRRESAEG